MAEKNTVVVDAEFEPIIPQYLKNLEADMAAIRQGLQDADSAVVAMNGHRIKGSGASFGFDELTRLGAGIENTARVGDLKKAGAYFDEMEAYMQNLEVVYEG